MNEQVLRDLKSIVGDHHLLTHTSQVLEYGTDKSLNQSEPSCVVFPTSTQDIIRIVHVLNKNNIPFVARGSGTNICGSSIPLHHAVVISMEKMNKILHLDTKNQTITVETGIIHDNMNQYLKEFNLFYAPDPASKKECTIGGNLATNAGGPHCLKYGVTVHHVEELTIVLPNAEVKKFGRYDDGPDWRGFFVGSESTLGIIVEARLNLLKTPRYRTTLLLLCRSISYAIQLVTQIISQGITPACLELMDKKSIEAVRTYTKINYPLSEAVLLIELEGSVPHQNQVEKILDLSKGKIEQYQVAINEQDRLWMWKGRRAIHHALSYISNGCTIIQDGAVPISQLPEATQRIQNIAQEYDIPLFLILHAGDGNFHPHLNYEKGNTKQLQDIREASYKMLKTCVDLGGTISGEHGIGIDKRNAMSLLFTPDTLSFFQQIKNVFDPKNISNPDKVLPKIPSYARSLNYTKKNYTFCFQPRNKDEIRNFILQINDEKKHIHITGMAHNRMNEVADYILQMSGLNTILEYEKNDFFITVESGLLQHSLVEFLKHQRQKCYLDGTGTIGGIIATNSPLQSLALDEQILGMEVMLYDGRIISLGAKVMKNVAGYNVQNLLIGSKGTLGVILSIRLRTYSINHIAQPRQLCQNTKNLNSQFQSWNKKMVRNIFQGNTTFV